MWRQSARYLGDVMALLIAVVILNEFGAKLRAFDWAVMVIAALVFIWHIKKYEWKKMFKKENTESPVEATLAFVDEENGTFIHPTTLETLPIDFELTAEEEEEMKKRLNNLTDWCREKTVPFFCLVQTQLKTTADGEGKIVSLLADSQLPGPRACAEIRKHLDMHTANNG